MKKRIGKMMVAAAAMCLVAATTIEVHATTNLQTQYDQIMAIIGSVNNVSNGPGTSNAASGPGSGSVSNGPGSSSVSNSPGSSGVVNGPGSQTTSQSAGPGASSSSGQNYGIVIESEQSSSGTSASAGSTLPVVKEVVPVERYFAEFGIYEEGIDGKYFFYTNTGNGSVTDKPVYVDIPDGVEYTVEHDGQQIPYESKMLLGTKGSYIFRFRIVHNEGASLSTETEYNATFRFRIDDKIPEAVDTSGTPSGSQIPADVLEYQALIDEMQKEIDELSKPNGGVFYNDEDLKKPSAESVTNPESTDANTPVSSNQTEEADKKEESQKSPELPEGYNPMFGLAEDYDSRTDSYYQNLLTGRYFKTNIPNGAIVNDNVTIELEHESTLLFNVMKDGEVFEYLPGDAITEDGTYYIGISSTDSSFESMYDGINKPVFTFRIIKNPVNNLEMLQLTGNSTMVSFVHDGNPLDCANNMLHFDGDGTYTMTYTAHGKEISADIVVDTVVPAANVVVENGTAKVEFNVSEVGAIVLTKDGQIVEYPSNHTITEIGKYELKLQDHAGNESVFEFEVKKHISTATILLVAMVIGLLAALGVFVVRIKKDTALN